MEYILFNIPRRNGGVKANKEIQIQIKNKKVKHLQTEIFQKFDQLK